MSKIHIDRKEAEKQKVKSHGASSHGGCEGHSLHEIPALLGGKALKGQFTPKSKMHIFPLTYRAIYQTKLFWCELPSFGDVGCLFSNIMKLNGALNVMLTVPKKYISKNHDPITQNYPQTFL